MEPTSPTRPRQPNPFANTPPRLFPVNGVDEAWGFRLGEVYDDQYDGRFVVCCLRTEENPIWISIWRYDGMRGSGPEGSWVIDGRDAQRHGTPTRVNEDAEEEFMDQHAIPTDRSYTEFYYTPIDQPQSSYRMFHQANGPPERNGFRLGDVVRMDNRCNGMVCCLYSPNHNGIYTCIWREDGVNGGGPADSWLVETDRLSLVHRPTLDPVPEHLRPREEVRMETREGLRMFPVEGHDERDGFRLGDIVRCRPGARANGDEFSGTATVCCLYVDLYNSDRSDRERIAVWRGHGQAGAGPSRSWCIVPGALELVTRPSTPTEEETLAEETTTEETPPEPKPAPVFVTEKSTIITPLKDEFIARWNSMADTHHNHLPELENDNKTVKRFIKEATAEKQELKDLLGLGGDLRLKILMPTTDETILAGNQHLRNAISGYVNRWLSDAGYNLDTLSLVDNTIHNPKGQQTKFTRALQQVVPSDADLDCSFSGFKRYCKIISGARELPNREACIAMIGAALKTKAYYYISCNPADFVTSSHNGGFSSCHGPNGIHFGGNLGLCLAKNVLLAYVGTPERKTGRMWIWIGDLGGSKPQVFQLKSYGVFPEHYRLPVREYIEHCLAPGQIWVKKKNPRFKVMNHNTTRGYFDHGDVSAAYIKANGWENVLRIDGRTPYCISCGNERDMNLRSGACSDCETGSGCECNECGCEVCEDDVCYIDGTPYCSDCVSWCDHCDNYYLNEDMRNATNSCGHELYLCRHCRNDHYSQCESCDEWFENVSDVEVMRGSVERPRTETQQWCEHCLEEDGGYCEVCERNVSAHGYDNDMCLECNSTHKKCPECGEINELTDCCEHDGEYYCPDCVPEPDPDDDDDDDDEEEEEDEEEDGPVEPPEEEIKREVHEEASVIAFNGPSLSDLTDRPHFVGTYTRPTIGHWKWS